jgi:nicotinate phosphoribosyltransferase
VAVWNQSRIEPKRWQLDWQGIRNGDYSDRYFWNGVRILQQLAQEGYRFAGHSPRLAQQGLDPQPPEPIGDIRVEMQFFARRKPFTVVAGIDTALAILQHATGYFEGERFVNTAHLLEVEAVHDGFIAPYEGDPMQIVPVLKVRGRYRDFALLETPLLGVLTRMSRIATNTYRILTSSAGQACAVFPRTLRPAPNPDVRRVRLLCRRATLQLRSPFTAPPPSSQRLPRHACGEALQAARQRTR